MLQRDHPQGGGSDYCLVACVVVLSGWMGTAVGKPVVPTPCPLMMRREIHCLDSCVMISHSLLQTWIALSLTKSLTVLDPA